MSKLEEWLCEYEKNNPEPDTDKLTAALLALLEKEEELPYDQRDFELTDEITKKLLILKGEDLAAIDENAEKLAKNIIKKYTAKPKRIKRILLIAALIAIMAALALSTFSVKNSPGENPKPPIDQTEVKNNPTPETNIIPNTNNETDIPDETTPPNNAETNDEPKPIGGSFHCNIHSFSYHSYPDIIVNYIGEDDFMNWQKSFNDLNNDERCSKRNILTCIEYFNVPNEIIINAYQSDFYYCDWDMEALLSKDEQAFSESSQKNISDNTTIIYRNKLNFELMMKISLFNIIKSKQDETTILYYNRISNNNTLVPACGVSFYDLVINTSITKDDLIHAYDKALISLNETYPHFIYDFDLLFDNRSIIEKRIETLNIPEYESRVKMIDALLHVEE